MTQLLVEVLFRPLLIFPRTRLLGAILLMPVIFTILLFHLLIDNRPHKLVETGIPPAMNVLIFSYYKDWKGIILKN